MNRWSVKWELDPATTAPEIARLSTLMPEEPASILAILAAHKQRGFGTRPPADEQIKRLRKDPAVLSIVLFNIDKDKHALIWNRPPPMSLDLDDLILDITRSDGRWFDASTPLAKRALTQLRKRGYVFQYDSTRGDHRIIRNPNKPSERPSEIQTPITPIPPIRPIPMKSNLAPEEESTAPNPQSSIINHQSPRSGFSFRSFQRDDMARGALMPGLLMGWEPGLGKTMPAFSMPWLWRSRHTLIVVQADLHEQLIKEGRQKFGVNVRIIDSQETALEMLRQGILPQPGSSLPDPRPPTSDLPSSAAMPQYFITAYNWLGYNGGDEWCPDETNGIIRNRRVTIAARFMGIAADDATLTTVTAHNWRPTSATPAHEVLGIPANATPEEIKAAYRTAAKLYHPDLHPGDMKAHSYFIVINAAYEKMTGKDTRNYDKRLAEFTKENPGAKRIFTSIHECEEGIGTEKNGIKCVFIPTLASIVHSTFDCVVCDEAVAIKSGTAFNAEGILRMVPPNRLALTGTPIKNKFPDLFFLASWVTGYHDKPTARFPYGNTTGDRASFMADFSAVEENLTKQEKEREQGNHRSFTKADPTQPCNVHKMWRVIAPLLIRRRKDDIPGCDIVPKTIIPIHCMPGTEQKKVYQFHIDNAPPFDSPLASIGAQLTCLRQAALHPANPQLRRPGSERQSVSTGIHTPKIAAVLKLATDLMAQGEQLVIASPYTAFSTDLSDILTASGIPHLCLDGRTSPTKRGKLLEQFKSGRIPVLIVGIKGMAAGHDLNCCANLALVGIEWALDLNRQIVDRVHRLNSPKPVNIYVLITKGTIDERLASVWDNKGDASDLILDGRLIEDNKEKLDAAAFLRDAVADFDPTAPTLCEKEVAAQWHATGSNQIRTAWETYRDKLPGEPSFQAASQPKQQPKEQIKNPQPERSGDSRRQSSIINPQSSPPTRSIYELMKQSRPQPADPNRPVIITPAAPDPRKLPIHTNRPAKKAATFPEAFRKLG